MRRLLALALLVAGCASYEPAPLPRSALAAELAARRLDDPGLAAHARSLVLGHRLARFDLADGLDAAEATVVALYFHPAFAAARARAAEAAADARQAGFLANPVLTLDPRYVFGADPFEIAADLSFTIPTAGKRRIRREAAEVAVAAARAAEDALAWEVRQEVRRAYTRFAAAEAELRLFEAGGGAVEELVRLSERRVAAGEAPRAEALAARRRAAEAEAWAADARSRAALARAALEARLGLPPGGLAGVTLVATVLVPADAARAATLTAAVEARLLRTALDARLDVARAELAYASAEKALELEVARQYPDLDFGPGVAHEDVGTKLRLGISFTIPIFDQNQVRIARALAARNEAAADLRAAVLSVEQGVHRAAIAVEAARAALAAEEEGPLAIAEADDALAARALAAGEISGADRASAAVALLLERRRFLALEAALAAALIDLETEVGRP
jgi:outer membrane protein TolC